MRARSRTHVCAPRIIGSDAQNLRLNGFDKCANTVSESGAGGGEKAPKTAETEPCALATILVHRELNNVKIARACACAGRTGARAGAWGSL